MNKPRRSRKAISQRRAHRESTTPPGPSYTPPRTRRVEARPAVVRPAWYRRPLYLGALALIALLILIAGAIGLWQAQPAAAPAAA
ncbi:MAG TPA: hypothetical protein VHL09_12075, partial [Dehalococcoidia bacterium]|nr:hypothetical protein [Dehalococcoidia bacterium]